MRLRLRSLRGERGFTAVEMMAAMAVMGIVMAAFGQLLITSSNTSNRVEE